MICDFYPRLEKEYLDDMLITFRYVLVTYSNDIICELRVFLFVLTSLNPSINMIRFNLSEAPFEVCTGGLANSQLIECCSSADNLLHEVISLSTVCHFA